MRVHLYDFCALKPKRFIGMCVGILTIHTCTGPGRPDYIPTQGATSLELHNNESSSIMQRVSFSTTGTTAEDRRKGLIFCLWHECVFCFLTAFPYHAWAKHFQRIHGNKTTFAIINHPAYYMKAIHVRVFVCNLLFFFGSFSFYYIIFLWYYWMFGIHTVICLQIMAGWYAIKIYLGSSGEEGKDAVAAVVKHLQKV